MGNHTVLDRRHWELDGDISRAVRIGNQLRLTALDCRSAGSKPPHDLTLHRLHCVNPEFELDFLVAEDIPPRTRGGDRDIWPLRFLGIITKRELRRGKKHAEGENQGEAEVNCHGKSPGPDVLRPPRLC